MSEKSNKMVEVSVRDNSGVSAGICGMVNWH